MGPRRAPAAPRAAQEVGEDVLEAGGFPARIVPGELEFARAPRAAAEGMTLLEAMRARIEAAWIARSIDLARVELGALVLVAQDVIGAGDFLKLLLRVGVARVLEEVSGNLAQDFVRISHSFSMTGRGLLGAIPAFTPI